MLLVGDIGGTKTDVAVFSPEGGVWEPVAQKRFTSADYPSLEAIASEFVAEFRLPLGHACFAVAGPVVNGRAVLTNLPWLVEESVLQSRLELESVELLNDVEAMAAAIPHLRASDVVTLQPGTPEPEGAIALIAVGTGLGEAFLTWDGARYRAHASEGGHSDFGPTSAEETELLRFSQTRWRRVSYERVCAGLSIPHLYEFLKTQGQFAESSDLAAELDAAHDRTPVVVAAALDAEHADPLSKATIELFAGLMGSQAGNLALTVLATGGVYIAGGMAQRTLPGHPQHQERFLSTFHDKGRLTPLLAKVPIHLIPEPVALAGAAVTAMENMRQSTEQKGTE
ncbi:MAG: glucokinase [Chloroflexi bacterium]|nr:glucokinase [Chloroflexota bacterium]